MSVLPPRRAATLAAWGVALLVVLYAAERALYETPYFAPFFFTVVGLQVAAFVGLWIWYAVRWHRARRARDGSDARLPLWETLLASIGFLLLPIVAYEAATGRVGTALTTLLTTALLLIPALFLKREG